MRIYYTGGTVGDAYVILCKLYSIARQGEILCSHRTVYKELELTIKEIYSLLPNISIEFREFESPTVEIRGAFRFLGQEAEQTEYGLDLEFYPKFELEDISCFNLPKGYMTLQIKAGSHGSRSLPPRAIKRILDGSKLPVVLVGENTADMPSANFNAVDLRGKTSIREVVSIINGGEHFYGPLGFLSFVAVSHKIMSDVYIKSQQDINAIKIRIEAVEEWRRFLVRR